MSKQEKAQLLQAIDILYEVFAPYPLPASTDPCRCCHSDEQEAVLHSKPLRKLGIEDLNAYAFDALLTWGDINTFKHLLPRIFELYLSSSEPDLWSLNPEIVFKKFSYGHWEKWPTNEKRAVRSLLHAVWAQAVAEQPEALFMDL